MKHYRPLLLQELDIRLPGLRLRRLRLNRHLPEIDSLSPHHHAFSQILYYVSGRGEIITDKGEIGIGPGSVAILPSRVQHGFRESTGRRPLCMAIDLDLRGAARRGFQIARLSQSDAATIRQNLSTLTRLKDPGDVSCRLVVAASVLQILDIILRSLGFVPQRVSQPPPFVRNFVRLLHQPETRQLGISDLALKMGYQADYLNRAFKQATGLTLREQRDKILLEQAKALLLSGKSVGDVAQQLDFSDQNYFARWFKKLTGIQPRALR